MSSRAVIEHDKMQGRPGHIPLELAEFYDLNQTRGARLWEAQGRRCHWCGCETILTRHNVPNQATEDHVIPRGRGGSNEESNVVSACLKCNARRCKEDNMGHREGHLLNKNWTRPFTAVSSRDLELERMQRELHIARWRYEQEHKRVLELESIGLRRWVLIRIYGFLRNYLRTAGARGPWKGRG
jgi:5-methylcytosine-specific restriction endonuclease McrA